MHMYAELIALNYKRRKIVKSRNITLLYMKES